MKLPIGIQDFEKIRTGGYLYIDKTEHVYRLASEGSYYFLSRPRRFGKSLLLSTIKALFLGKRELFAGLAIDQKEDWDWAVHPVLHLDLNTNKYDKAEVSIEKITDSLQQHQVRLLKDSAMLDKMYEQNLVYFKELTMYIRAGKQK